MNANGRNQSSQQEKRDIVHARLGEVYAEEISQAGLVAWLAKNPEFKLVAAGTEYSGWWGTNVLTDEDWYVDGPEDGPEEVK